MKRSLLGYGATLSAFVALDAAWLALFAIDLFERQVGAILREQPNMGAVMAFYPIYAAGLYTLAVCPASQERSRRRAVVNGSVLGLAAYAAFDLTNLAIIAGWTIELALTDMAWGTVASALAATAGYAAASWVAPVGNDR